MRPGLLAAVPAPVAVRGEAGCCCACARGLVGKSEGLPGGESTVGIESARGVALSGPSYDLLTCTINSNSCENIVSTSQRQSDQYVLYRSVSRVVRRIQCACEGMPWP